jgi:hypothetical protein
MERIETAIEVWGIIIEKVWFMVNSLSDYITGDGSWILFLIILIIWLYRYDSTQEETLNKIYDERKIDPDDHVAVYRNESNNIRDLQLVSIKTTLYGILIVLLIGLYKIW